MKNIFIMFLLMFCSVSLFGQKLNFDENKLNVKQKQEFAIHTEGCTKTKVVYTDHYGKKFPVYYDPAAKTTFYVQVVKRHVLTVDLDRQVAFVD